MAEALPDVVARLTADADDFIRDWNRAAREAEKDAAEIRAAIRAAGDGPDTSALRDMERDLRRVGEGARAAGDQLRTLQRALHDAMEAGDSDRIRQLEERIRALGGSARGSSDDVDDLGNSTRRLGGSLGEAVGRLSGFQYVLIAIASILPAIAAAALAGGAAILGLGVAAGVAALGSRGLGQAFDRLAATTAGLRAHLDSLFRSQLSSEMNKLGQAVSQLEPQFKGVASAISDVIKDTTQWIRSSEGMNEIKTILGGVRDLIENLRPGVQAIVKLFVEFGAAAAPSLAKIGAALSYIFQQLESVFKEAEKSGQMTKAFDAGASALRGFGDVAAGLSKILIEMATQGGEPAASAISKFGKALGDMAPFIGQVFAALAMMADALMTVVGWIAKGIAAIKEFNDGMGGFKGSMAAVAGALGAAGAAVMKFFHDLKQGVIALEDTKIGPWFDGMVKDITTGVAKARQTVKDWSQGVNKDIDQGIAKAVQTVKDWWTKTTQDIAQGVQKAVQTVKDWFTKTVQDVKTGVTKAVQAVKEWFTKTVQDVKTGITKAVEAVKEWWEKTTSEIATGIEKAVDKVKEFVTNAVQTLTDGVRDFVKAGADMVEGLIQGVTSKASEFVEKIKQMAQDAVNAVKGLLGISSPSKLFADEVGVQIPAGIAAGIAGGAHLVEDALRRTVPNTSITMASARAAAVGQAGAGPTNLHVTISAGSGADSAMGTAIAKLARSGQLKITASAVVGRH